MRIEDAGPRGVKLVHHLDQRDPVEAGCDAIEHFGGLRIRERGKLLHLAEADGENVAERRLVNIRQERLDGLLALADPVARGDVQLIQPRIAVGRSISGNLKLPARSGYLDRTARPPAVLGRQVATAFGRETVKSRANEVQHGRFARLVRAVDHIDALAHALELQAIPDAIAFDIQGEEFHKRSSVKVVCILPKLPVC